MNFEHEILTWEEIRDFAELFLDVWLWGPMDAYFVFLYSLVDGIRLCWLKKAPSENVLEG